MRLYPISFLAKKQRKVSSTKYIYISSRALHYSIGWAISRFELYFDKDNIHFQGN